MALTDTQKSQTRRWLGVPDTYRQYDLRLESAMDALSTEGEAIVITFLAELETIRAQLADARACRLKVLSVEDVVMAGGEEIRHLWLEGNRIVQDLGVALYFEPRRRAFGTQPASWAGGGGGQMRRG